MVDVLRPELPPVEGSDPSGGHWSHNTVWNNTFRAEKQQITDVEGSHLSERSWSGIFEQMLSFKK